MLHWLSFSLTWKKKASNGDNISVIRALGRWRQGDSWGLLTSQCSLPTELQIRERPCLKEGGQCGAPEDDTAGFPMASLCMCVHEHLYTHVHTTHILKIPHHSFTQLMAITFLLYPYDLGSPSRRSYTCIHIYTYIYIIRYKL